MMSSPSSCVRCPQGALWAVRERPGRPTWQPVGRPRELSVSQQIGLLFVLLFGLLTIVRDLIVATRARCAFALAGHQERFDQFVRDLRAVWLGAVLFWVAWVARARSSRRCCSACSRSWRCASSSR